MSAKANMFSNGDLLTHNWYIPAGSGITEMKLEGDSCKAASAKLQQDCPLVHTNFQVVSNPPWGYKIPDHICFQYTNSQGNITFVYVHEANVKIQVPAPPTWTTRNKQNVI